MATEPTTFQKKCDDGQQQRPVTVLRSLRSVAHLLNQLRALVIENGQRVACFCETESMASNLCEWMDTIAEEKISIALTADINEAAGGFLGENVTKYIADQKGVRFFAYTTAIGVGVVLSTEFDTRVAVCERGVMRMKEVAQMIQIPCNLKNYEVLVYVVDS